MTMTMAMPVMEIMNMMVDGGVEVMEVMIGHDGNSNKLIYFTSTYACTYDVTTTIKIPASL